jgi:hypothetical protein
MALNMNTWSLNSKKMINKLVVDFASLAYWSGMILREIPRMIWGALRHSNICGFCLLNNWLVLYPKESIP